MPTFERRKARSHIKSEAVRLFLESNAQRAGVRAVALSDAQGFLIGGSGDIDLEVLAALGPLFVTGTSPSLSRANEELIDEVVQNHDLYASKLQFRGATFVLTSVGSRFPEQRRAERAFERILSEETPH